MDSRRIALVALLLFLPSLAQAEKVINICRNSEGNVLFSDNVCENNKTGEHRIFIRDHPSTSEMISRRGHRAIAQQRYRDPNEAMLREWRQKAYSHLSAERQAPRAPSWGERKAARNAQLSANHQRWLDESRGKKRNAADWAHQYNAGSLSEGSRHQVRVPDITEVNIYGDREGRNSYSIYERRGSLPSDYQAEQNIPSNQGWRERTAAKNARRSANNQRWLDERRGRKRSSADWAHQYNTGNVSSGGTHQVRVPDVTEVNIRPDSRLHIDGVPATPVGNGNYMDPQTGRILMQRGGGVVDPVTGRFYPFQ